MAKNHIVADGVDQYLVYRLFAEQSYAREGWVGWNPLKYGGTADYANTMALYFDWTMQLHRWFDFWTAWHLGLFGQVAIAALGGYVLLHGRGMAWIWCIAGGLAYAANSQFVGWVFHRWSLGAFCWVPWVLWACDAYGRGRRWAWGLVPVFLALAFMGGTLQHAVLVVMTVVLWCVAMLWERRGIPGESLRLLMLYAAWGVLGVALAGVMFLPCTGAFLESNRLGIHMGLYGNAENGVYPQGLLQPLFNLLAYPLMVFPSLLGRCDSLDVLKLFKSDLFYVAYCGALPVLAGYCALWRRDLPVVARLLVWAGLLLPLTPLVRVLYQRMYYFFLLGAVLAFAHWMTHAGAGHRRIVSRWLARGLAFATGIWLAASAALVAMPQVRARMTEKAMTMSGSGSFGYYKLWLAQRVENFVGDLVIWSPQQILPLGLLAVGIVGLRWTASTAARARNVGGYCVALAVVAEVTLFAARWVVWADPAKHPLFAETPESRALQEHCGRDGRTTTVMHPTAHMACTPFLLNTQNVFGVASISGYDSIMPDGMILPGAQADDAELLGRLGVSHLLTWGGNPDVPTDWRKVWGSAVMDLYENPLAVPRYAGFRSARDGEEFFAGREVPPVALVEKTGGYNSRILEVPAGIESIRIAENQASGWQYREGASGGWRDVGRAVDGSMLVAVEASNTPSEVELRYDPPLLRYGRMVSLGALVIVALGALERGRKLKC